MKRRMLLLALAVVLPAMAAMADVPSDGNKLVETVVNEAASNEQAGDYIKWIALVTVLSLAPALAIMVTAFVRIVVVLGIFRHGLGSPQLPPNQVIFALSLLMTLVVMAPVANDIYAKAYEPFKAGEIESAEAIKRSESSIRKFMIAQIDAADNADAVYAFLDEKTAKKENLAWRDVPTLSLVPGFAVSELKIAFSIGLRIFLPFLIIDLLVAAILVSAGMFMVPPTLVSLPLKLLLFVLADGWVLMTSSLVGSFV